MAAALQTREAPKTRGTAHSLPQTLNPMSPTDLARGPKCTLNNPAFILEALTGDVVEGFGFLLLSRAGFGYAAYLLPTA